MTSVPPDGPEPGNAEDFDMTQPLNAGGDQDKASSDALGDATVAGQAAPTEGATPSKEKPSGTVGGGTTRSSDTMGAPATHKSSGALKLSPAEAALIGKQLGGCHIHQLLGRGAMGSVFRATQIHLDREVAVKTIRPDMLLNESVAQRFRSEGLSQSRFTSPYVVPVYEAGEQNGIVYLVMRYVPGGTLRNHTETLPFSRLPERDALRFLLQCVEGLKEAELHNILHRDIKPDNILLDEQGRAMLSDFGIAKMLDSGINLTQSMDHVGTPLYMSPEQCRADELDFRTDMYSLGATFFYLVTNLPPARGSSILELIQTKTSVQYLSPAQALPDFENSTPLSRVIERMTALEREHRYESWEALEEDIRAAMKGIAPKPGAKQTESATVADQDAEPASSGGRGKLAAAVLVVALAAGGGYGYSAGWFDSLLGKPTAEPVAEQPTGGTPAEASTGQNTGAIVEAGDLPSNDAPSDGLPSDGLPSDGDQTGAAESSGANANSTVVLTPPPVVPIDPPQPVVEPDSQENLQALPVQDIEDLTDAQEQLASYQASFAADGPRGGLADALKAFILRGSLDINHDDIGSLRNDYQNLLERVEGAERKLEDLRQLPLYDHPKPPFSNLERYLERCSEAIVALRGADGQLPRWATRPVAERIPTRLFEESEQSLSEACRSVQQTLDAGLASVDAAELREMASGMRDLRTGQQRLARLMAATRDPAPVPQQLQDKVAGAAEQLTAIEADLQQMLAVVGARDGIRGLKQELDGVSTLSAWRARQSPDRPGIADSLATLVADGVPRELAREYGDLTYTLDEWKNWDGRMADATRRVAAGDAVADVAADLAAAQSQDRAAGRRTPADMQIALETLQSLAAAFQQLAETADVATASKMVQASLAGEKRVSLDLMAGDAAKRIRGAEDALEKLANNTQGMVAIPAGTVAMEWTEGRSRQRDEAKVDAFLMAPTEASNRDWVAFLKGSQAADFAAVRTRLPNVWKTESDWRQAMGMLRDAEQHAQARPDLPPPAIPHPLAAAFARSRGGSLPSMAQWWLVARGAKDDTRAFPWGKAGSRGSEPIPSGNDAVHHGTDRPTGVAQGGLAWRSDALGQSIHHLAGNVAEWLRADPNDPVRRCIGGSYETNKEPDRGRKLIYSGGVVLLHRSGVVPKGVGVRVVCEPKAALGSYWLN